MQNIFSFIFRKLSKDLNCAKYFLPHFFQNVVKGVFPHTICLRKVSEKSKTAKDLEETTEKPIVTTTLSYLPRRIDVIRM